eukprot:6356572-Prymnesium_polylepis.1
MEMAAGIGGDTNRMRIVVRPGRFRLRGPLPEVSGVVDIVGSGGRRKPRRALPNPVGKMSAPKPGKETQGLVDEKERKRLQQKREDESDDADIYYNPDAGTGQTSPIGTVIDGDGKFQSARAAHHASTRRRAHRRAGGGARARLAVHPRRVCTAVPTAVLQTRRRAANRRAARPRT